MHCHDRVRVGDGDTMDYVMFVESLKKPLSHEMDLLHMALGIAGEAGEVVELIKKHVIYGKELNLVKLTDELGDLNFYITGLQSALQIADDAITHMNVAKLSKRYSSGSYSDEQAIARADTQT